MSRRPKDKVFRFFEQTKIANKLHSNCSCCSSEQKGRYYAHESLANSQSYNGGMGWRDRTPSVCWQSSQESMVCETVTSKKGNVGVIIAVPEDRCESLCALLQWELSIQRLALIPKTTLLFCLDIHIWVRESYTCYWSGGKITRTVIQRVYKKRKLIIVP